MAQNPSVMQFELTKDFLSDLRQSIKDGQMDQLSMQFSELHPADIAEIFDSIPIQEAKRLYDVLESEHASDVLVHLEEDVREKLLTTLTSKEIAETIIDNLESDDAADLLSELTEEQQEEVIRLIKDSEQASDLVDLLGYEEGTAGALMAKELIAVNASWTVMKCVREMRRQAEEVEQVYTVYVVDDNEKLLGRLSVKELLLTPVDTEISNIYKPGIKSVTAEMDEEEVASVMEKYDLVVVPVVDETNRLVGRITIDDILDVIKEEAEKDYQLASGIAQNVESSDTVWLLSRARLPWLLIGLVGGILGAWVIGLYEGDLKIYPEMAFFIPLIAAMGGNVGVQASAIIVQGLANKTIDLDSIPKKLLKELGVALINGLVCSIIILSYNLFASDSQNLSLTVSIALLAVIIVAGLFGTFIPLVLNRYKIDPALATGPFITTVNDILGLFIYFAIGRIMYDLPEDLLSGLF